jgi:hypothetical protein
MGEVYIGLKKQPRIVDIRGRQISWGKFDAVRRGHPDALGNVIGGSVFPAVHEESC